MNQHSIFINQSGSCCLVSIHHGLYYDIQMIQCAGVCVLSWSGQREKGGVMGERAKEINACGERLFSAVKGSSSVIESFSAELMRGLFMLYRPSRSVDFRLNTGLTTEDKVM